MSCIGDHAVLGDCHSAALVGLDGAVDWWCPARFDAASVFARLLDATAGHWSIRPTEDYRASRRYVEGTMVLETEFSTDSGLVRVTDALALGAGERGHDIGYESPHVLIRKLEGLSGEVEVGVELAARLEYGLIRPQVKRTEVGTDVVGGADRLHLIGDRRLNIDGPSLTARFTVAEGDSCAFALHHRRSVDPIIAPLDPRASLADTIAGWQSWTGMHNEYQGPYRDEVTRSALVLEALTYRPTGAVIAAATTSLPEKIGGSANWDYRFGWVRDGSFTLKALWVAACPHESRRFFDWIASSAALGGQDHLPIIFAPDGRHDLTEHELDHLTGYRDSSPVRVGNDAWKQKQLDVLGEVLESAWILRDQLDDIEPTTWSFLRDIANRAAASWQEADAGIWEGREGERHYLTSKIMCWVALDRAVKLGERLGNEDDVVRWYEAREQVRATILSRGWNDSIKAFTGALDSDHLDAGVLLMPLVGFLPGDDHRVLATIEAIERELTNDSLVRRWTGAEDEGAFIICSYWLAAAQALAGRLGRAKEIFETVTAYANDVGLLSEEIDPRDGTLIGNFPQGLSHIGLINAAAAIRGADRPDRHDKEEGGDHG